MRTKKGDCSAGTVAIPKGNNPMENYTTHLSKSQGKQIKFIAHTVGRYRCSDCGEYFDAFITNDNDFPVCPFCMSEYFKDTFDVNYKGENEDD